MSASSPTTGAQTITRAVRALKLIAEQPNGLRLTDLAEDLELTQPTAHRLLQTLMSERMLVRDDRTRRYTLGPLVFELGLASNHHFNLRDICMPILESLAERSGDTSFLFVRSGNDAVCLSRVQGNYPIQTPMVEIGSRQPLGVNAGGLALLSCLSEAELMRTLEAIAARLPAYGELDTEELRAHCARAQQQGFAWIANKAAPGVSALGLPIRSSTGTAIAAITVAATVERMNDQRVKQMLPLLRDAAFQITQLLRQ
jgi:DNA-binding IclR family transcriptional regulator